jgi:hypothetical protein
VETLADRIARDGPVSELDAIGWAIRLAKRIETLHMLGVSHGSVSPACVLTEGRDRNARAYLADLQHTKASLVFQSPERIQGGDLSAADDVWALGVTLYALLTGQNPFAGANDAEARQKILAASPPPLAVFDVGDDDLQHIIDRVFARELASRTASAVAFRRSLEEWHPDRGVAKLPPLEDEDDDDDDNARTMLVTDASFMRSQAQAKLPSVAGADGDEDARTVMRPLPQGGVAALFPRGAAPASSGGAPKPAVAKPENVKPAPPATKAEAPKPPMQPPHPGSVPRPVPRPATKTGAPQGAEAKPGPVVKPTVVLQPPISLPKPPAASAPAPASAARHLPKLIEEESSDDNVRTVMRDPEQLQAQAPSQGPLGAAASLKQPATAEQTKPFATPFAPPLDDDDNAPAATLFLSSDDNAPAPTMALPEAFGDKPASRAAVQGTQKIPPGMVPLAPSPQPAPQPVPQPTVPLSSYLQEQAQIAMRSHDQLRAPAPPAQPMGYAAPAQPVGYAAPAPAPMMPPPSSQPAESGPGKGKLFLAAFVALVVAAGVTFALLKLKGF